jgi:hypothetical protein
VVKLPVNKTDIRRFEPTVVAFEHEEKIKLNSLRVLCLISATFRKKGRLYWHTFFMKA